MSAEAYPRTSMRQGIYKRIAETDTNRVENYIEPVYFFYIGNDTTRIERLSAFFPEGTIAAHFSSAEQLLKNFVIRKEALPDVIILDVPFVEPSLQEFIEFLRSNSQLSSIPVIYNRKHIINGYKDRLKKTKLVDDIVDVDNGEVNLSEKINFLRQAKAYPQTLKKAPMPKAEPCYRNCMLKRSLDILLASLAVICLLPVFILIALAIKIESRGPIFYNSYRAGRGFKIFKFFKFRTMELDADKKLDRLAHLNQYNNSVFFKVNNDPRVTRFGGFLRKTSLDELPQLFNVLMGDMSIVGNRPLPLYEAATLTTNESVERFMAPAGMTGLWQIKKRGKENMSTEERISLDIDYARKHNFKYDLWIMAHTPSALLQKSNV